MTKTPARLAALADSLTLRYLIVFALFLLAWPPAPAHATEARAAGAGQVVHMLDYIAFDYAGAVSQGQVADAGEFAEMREFAHQVVQLIDTLPDADPALRRPLALGARQLAVRIEARADGAEIARLAAARRRARLGAGLLRRRAGRHGRTTGRG